MLVLTKKQVKIIFAVTIIVLSIFGIILSDNSSNLSSPFKNFSAIEESDQITSGNQIMGSSDSEVTVSPSALDEGLSEDEVVSESVEDSEYKVIKVVDGDTLDVEIDGKTERLRLIGIDTPETVDPRKSVQCFGKEASKAAKELLEGQFVILESDETQGERDKYKRLLRYVFLPDKTNFNLYMVAEGYAHEYTYDEPYKYQADFKQAEIDARAQNKGLWSPATCSGNK